jgi:hypothetical protein
VVREKGEVGAGGADGADGELSVTGQERRLVGDIESRGAIMFFKKPKTVICSACGKEIEPREPRFVDKNRVTKAERHTHISCAKGEQPRIAN